MSPETIVTGAFTHLLPLALLVWQLPRRSLFWLRAFAGAAAVLAYAAVTGVFGFGIVELARHDAMFFVLEALMFSAYLPLMMGGVLLAFDTDAWTALFCASAAYVTQNLVSGLGNLVDYCIGSRLPGPGDSSWWSYLISAVVLLAYWYLFARPIHRWGTVPSGDRRVLLLALVVIFYNIVFDMASKDLWTFGVTLPYLLVFSSAHIGICLLTLYLEYELLFRRTLQIEAAATERVMHDRERQYEQSRANIDAINVKVHDIRHQIRHYADGRAVMDSSALGQIAHEVDIYDSAVSSGNEALDTILTEKSLLCERRGIELTCAADGSALSFLTNAELYSFFGNALDNAIEAVSQVDDPAKRAISLSVRKVAGMASIHVENYYAGRVKLVDGVPQSTKGDPLDHGFGTKSMMATAERHDGVVTFGTEGQVFYLNAVIPLAE